MARIGIVVPVYKEEILEYEKYSLSRLKEVLGRYPIIFVAPNKLSGDMYRKIVPQSRWQTFANGCFQGFSAYNKLLLSDDFYSAFSDYDKILICQTDVLVLEDRLEEFLSLPYDYIGAPIAVFKNDLHQLYGGNGGFSLRCVRSFMRILEKHREEAERWTENEDEFFSYCGEMHPDEFCVAPPKIAMRFAFDRFSRYMYRKNHEQLPMAWHGWLTYDPEFSCRFIFPEAMHDCHSEMQLRTYSEAMREFHSFIGAFSHIYIYGAGQWGKTVYHYLKMNNVVVKGFIVSDDQFFSGDAYQGTPVHHVSELAGKDKSCGIIFAIGRRYLSEETVKSLEHSINNAGFQHLLYIDVVTYNGIVENLLSIREGGSA